MEISAQGALREFKRKLLDCEFLILINDQHQNTSPIEQIFLDINEKAQLLEIEDIFKGYCFENYDDAYHQDLRATWVNLKKQGMQFTRFGFENLSQYGWMKITHSSCLYVQALWPLIRNTQQTIS